MTQTLKGLTCCWIGNGRYNNPLDSTSEKKWRALTDLGVNMIVVGFATGLRPRHFTQHADFYLLPQPNIALLRYAVMLLIVPWLCIWLIFRRKVNVFIAQSPYEGAVAALAKNIARVFSKRVKLIVENHGDFEESVFMQRKITLTGLYRAVMRAFARYAFRHADALRTISKSTREQLAQWITDKPVHEFMAWTDADAFLNLTRAVPLSQTHDLVFAGVLIPRKGVHILIDAFARVVQQYPDAHLWLVGKPENPEYTASLHQQVQKHGIANQVTFVGAVTQNELAQYMAKGRALVVPSISEGLGRVVIEAMMCGTPVVGSNVGGIPDIVTDGETGYLVPPEDVDALVDTLLKLEANTVIDAMGRRASDFAQRYFSTDAYVEGYRRLIKAVM